jgi:heat-inducible transcriptional repressor
MSQPAFPGHLNREDPDLGERHRLVFEALLRLHGRTARPVGSEPLAARAGIRLSAASVRATLAELEAMGLLERSSASSGRVPTARGYEYFVRVLLAPAVLPAAVLEDIDRRLSSSARDVEALLAEASRVLSAVTRQLGLALAHALAGETLTRLDLEALDERRALLVLDLGPGATHTLMLELESPLERESLLEVAEVLRAHLVGLPLAAARERLAHDPELVRGSALRIVARAADESWTRPVSTPLYRSGIPLIAEQPEFAGPARLAPLLRAVEDGVPLDRLLVTGVEGHAAVRVGLDEARGLSGCSLVSFPLPGSIRAAVGVLGPVRMDYAHVFAAVDAVGSRVTDLLQS